MYVRKIYLSGLAVFFLVLYAGVGVYGSSALLVDTRLMVIAHPLFKAYDSCTSRFKGTSSEFVSGGQEGIDKLTEQIRKNEEKLAKSNDELRQKLREAPLPDRINIERTFIREKRQLEEETLEMKIRAYNARLTPGRLGVTPPSSIYPQVNQINADIKAVIIRLKEKYKIELVIDATELLPARPLKSAVSRVVAQNKHQNFIKTGTFDQQTVAWFVECAEFWADEMGMDAPILPVGVTDVRLVALKMIEDLTRGDMNE